MNAKLLLISLICINNILQTYQFSYSIGDETFYTDNYTIVIDGMNKDVVIRESFWNLQNYAIEINNAKSVEYTG
nr:MAG: hypothetical protein DiTV3a_F25ORF2 [Diabrotica toursvirus 3a]